MTTMATITLILSNTKYNIFLSDYKMPWVCGEGTKGIDE